jgi:hypothetical protein
VSATEVRRPGLRERVSRLEIPNFRDDRGGAVAPHLLRLLQRLQRRHGETWASESGLRHMIAQDTGHMPGVGTVPAVLDRLQRDGLLEQVWILGGSLLPSGEPAHHGTRGIHVAQDRAERRAIRARNRRRRFRERRVLRSVEQAEEVLRQPPRASHPVMTSSAGEDFEHRRVEALRQARELESRWKSEKPPE